MPLASLAAFPRRHAVAIVGGAAVCLSALAVAPRVLRGPEVPVRAVMQRDLVQSVVASGHVEAPHRVTIGAVVVGNVLRVPVAEGQVVSAGQVLVALDGSEWAAAAAQADAAVAQA